MSVMLTDGKVPTLTAAQHKIRKIAQRPSKRVRDLMKPSPVTVLVARPAVQAAA